MNPLRRTPNPHLLEIYARPWLRRIAGADRRPSLDLVPDPALDAIRKRGFHGVWLMGAWTTGPSARALALEHPELRREYARVLPDWTEEDVGGSPYSVAAYEPGPDTGGGEALARFRERLHERDLGLVLDFVPNHVGRDHPWTDEHPEWLVAGTRADLARAPADWFLHRTKRGREIVLAHGRDPYFAGWTDTVQVEHRRRVARDALGRVMLDLAERCDGLRCDMAMLVLADVFEKTWGSLEDGDPGDFWMETIGALRRRGSDTVLLAEAYWDMEPRLIAAGFDFAYDKALYDALLAGDADAVRRVLHGPADRVARGAHFLENHDEERALARFGAERLAAASAVTFALPGLRFFHDGQDDGRRVRLPVQLSRAPQEAVVPECAALHRRLELALSREIFHRGTWSPLDVRPPGEGEPVPPMVGSLWTRGTEIAAVIANPSGATAYARVPLPLRDGGPETLAVEDELTGEVFERTRREMRQPGIFVKLDAWGAHFLRLRDEPG